MQLKTHSPLKFLNSQLSSGLEEGGSKSIQYHFNQNLDNRLLDPQDLKTKTSVILNNVNNPEIEWDYRRTCSLYEKQSSISIPKLQDTFQEFVNAYHKITSLYLIREVNKRTNLFIYDTESQRELRKPLKTPKLVDKTTCIAPLPNGKLFCFGKGKPSGFAFIISEDFSVRELPSGTPCCLSSAIYFKKSIYCFGGSANGLLTSALSERFDMDKNRWFKLTPMLQGDYCCHCIVFKRNILIAGMQNNLMLYSVDLNSFSIIPYEFKLVRKIIIKVGRLYIIECGMGFIYESEAEDEYTWKQIAKSGIRHYPYQVSCSYNKGGVYIGYIQNPKCNYWKFRLDIKKVYEL